MEPRESRHMGRIKSVYFIVNGVNELVEFYEDESVESLRDTFACSAGSDGSAILKLRNSRGSIVSITSRIAENTPKTRYTLEVIEPRLPSKLSEDASLVALDKVLAEAGTSKDELLKRLSALEEKTNCVNFTADLQLSNMFLQLSLRMNDIQQKIREAEYMVWMGFKKQSKPKNFSYRRSFNVVAENSVSLPAKYRVVSRGDISNETSNYLKTVSFDNWQWEDDEMIYLLKVMFYDLGLVDRFNIDTKVLSNFAESVRANYNDNPFHNFRHGFCVTQMMYYMLHKIDLVSKVDSLDIMCLIIACVGHDLDHPGFNNAYQINANTDLAILYNDISPLENHHCSVLFEILHQPQCNILQTLTDKQRSYARKLIILLILSTDMAKHGDIMAKFKTYPNDMDLSIEENRFILYQLLIKCSDISNEARPNEVAEPWCDCLLEEFFAQSDTEKLEGLPVAPFMDRDKVTKSSAQVGFISFVILPLFEQVARVCPSVHDIITEIRLSLNFYKHMSEKS